MKLSPYSGLADVHNKTGWVYTAHNRMWSSEVTYAKANGGKYDWIVNSKGALPMSEEFWMWLMGEGVTWGLQMYEQDWLYQLSLSLNLSLSLSLSVKSCFIYEHRLYQSIDLSVPNIETTWLHVAPKP